MPWTTPPDFVAGTVLTEANLDILSNDLNFLFNPPRCRIYRSTNQSLTSAVVTAISFDSERYDTDSMHEGVTNPTRITFTTAGTYGVGAAVSFAANGSAVRDLRLRLNGTTFIAWERRAPTSGSDETNMVIHTEYKFAAGDYVECVVMQSSGGALNVLASPNYSPEFWATWIGS